MGKAKRKYWGPVKLPGYGSRKVQLMAKQYGWRQTPAAQLLYFEAADL